MFNYRIFSVLGLSFLFLPSATMAVAYCETVNSPALYVQAICMLPEQKRTDEQVPDFGGEMRMNSDPPATRIYASLRGNPQQSQPVKLQGLRHPCRSKSSGQSQVRLNAQACSILSGEHDPGNPACRELASGTGRHSPSVHRTLIAMCRQR